MIAVLCSGLISQWRRAVYRIIAIAGAVFWLSLFPSLARHTYISENALLVGHASASFNEENAQRGLKYAEACYASSDAREYVATQLRSFGVQVLEQRLENGLMNVQGVHRPAGTDGTEAIVISVQVTNDRTGDEVQAVNVGLAMSIFESVLDARWLSRNVVLLAVDGEEGLEAWLKDYEYSAGIPIGAVRAVIHIALHSAKYDRIILKPEGINGQLPNLDLFNAIAYSTASLTNVDVALANPTCDVSKLSSADEKQVRLCHISAYLQTLVGKHWGWLNFVGKLAIGAPTGLHGLFLKHHMNAVTISSSSTVASTATSFFRGQMAVNGVRKLGVSVQTVIRAMSNMIEELHQSFFFYILIGFEHFISIGEYIGPAIILAAVPLLKAFQLRANFSADAPFVTPMLVLCGSIVAGAMSFFGGLWVASGLPRDISAQLFLALCGTVQLLFVALSSVLIRRHTSSQLPNVLWCYALCYFAMVMITMTLYSYALALVVLVFTSPILLLVNLHKLVGRLLSLLLLVVMSPLVVGAVGGFLCGWEHIQTVLDNYVRYQSLFAPLLLLCVCPVYATGIVCVIRGTSTRGSVDKAHVE